MLNDHFLIYLFGNRTLCFFSLALQSAEDPTSSTSRQLRLDTPVAVTLSLDGDDVLGGLDHLAKRARRAERAAEDGGEDALEALVLGGEAIPEWVREG